MLKLYPRPPFWCPRLKSWLPAASAKTRRSGYLGWTNVNYHVRFSFDFNILEAMSSAYVLDRTFEILKLFDTTCGGGRKCWWNWDLLRCLCINELCLCRFLEVSRYPHSIKNAHLLYSRQTNFLSFDFYKCIAKLELQTFAPNNISIYLCSTNHRIVLSDTTVVLSIKWAFFPPSHVRSLHRSPASQALFGVLTPPGATRTMPSLYTARHLSPPWDADHGFVHLLDDDGFAVVVKSTIWRRCRYRGPQC